MYFDASAFGVDDKSAGTHTQSGPKARTCTRSVQYGTVQYSTLSTVQRVWPNVITFCCVRRTFGMRAWRPVLVSLMIDTSNQSTSWKPRHDSVQAFILSSIQYSKHRKRRKKKKNIHRNWA